jgi:hypothetical protein
LIDAQNGFHVWSQTYDRKLEDIFAIQDEIARAIGDELKVTIASPTSPGQGSVGTRNLGAYDLYLRRLALALDPAMPEPYAALAAPASWERRRISAPWWLRTTEPTYC